MKKITLAAVGVLGLLVCRMGPPAPELLYPPDGATLLNLPFTWTSVPEAKNYLFEVAQDEGFSPSLISEIVQDTSYDIRNAPGLEQLLPGFVYYWHVRSGDGTNWGRPSEARTFHIITGGKP